MSAGRLDKRIENQREPIAEAKEHANEIQQTKMLYRHEMGVQGLMIEVEKVIENTREAELKDTSTLAVSRLSTHSGL